MQEYLDSPASAADLDSLLLAVGDIFDDVAGSSEEDNLSKLVLARQVKLTIRGQLRALDLLDMLKQKDPCSYQFALVLPDGSAFVASTPERLYAREGRNIISEAVAGAFASLVLSMAWEYGTATASVSVGIRQHGSPHPSGDPDLLHVN
jgi:chorismate binding enzyme